MSLNLSNLNAAKLIGFNTKNTYDVLNQLMVNIFGTSNETGFATLTSSIVDYENYEDGYEYSYPPSYYFRYSFNSVSLSQPETGLTYQHKHSEYENRDSFATSLVSGNNTKIGNSLFTIGHSDNSNEFNMDSLIGSSEINSFSSSDNLKTQVVEITFSQSDYISSSNFTAGNYESIENKSNNLNIQTDRSAISINNAEYRYDSPDYSLNYFTNGFALSSDVLQASVAGTHEQTSDNENTLNTDSLALSAYIPMTGQSIVILNLTDHSTGETPLEQLTSSNISVSSLGISLPTIAVEDLLGEKGSEIDGLLTNLPLAGDLNSILPVNVLTGMTELTALPLNLMNLGNGLPDLTSLTNLLPDTNGLI